MTEQKIEIFGYLKRQECEVCKSLYYFDFIILLWSKLCPFRTYVAEITEDFPDPTSLSIIRFKQKELEITGTKSLNWLQNGSIRLKSLNRMIDRYNL